MHQVDYSGALLKLQRAETHIGEVDYLVFRYLRQQPYRIRQEADFETEKYEFFISLTKRLPLELPLAIGDAAHNLRATLDYLIAACAIANGRTPNDTAFPMGSDRVDFEKRLKDKARKAGEVARNIIRDLKPYPGGSDALVDLHQLDLIDKHRRVVAVAGAGDFRFRHLRRVNSPQVIIEDRVHLLGDGECFVPAAKGHETDFPSEIGLTVAVIFPGDGPFGNMPCVRALNETAALVREILQRFQRDCSTVL